MKSKNLRNPTRAAVLAIIASLGVTLSACDSTVIIDPDSTMGTITEDNTGGVNPDGTDVEAVDLISAAEADGRFTTLLTAIEAADLRDQLADIANVNTVFAPTDTAFEAVDADALSALLADTEALNDTLLYHVTAGSNDISAIAGFAGQTIPMLNGKSAAISDANSVLRINTSIIELENIIANNGVLHVIDSVLTPPVENTAAESLTGIISSDPQFTTLTTALQATGLDTTLGADGDFTVFAPNNAAFEALGAVAVDALIADPDALSAVLLYHVVENQRIDSTTALAAAGTTINSATGAPLSVSIDGNALKINSASVIRADIAATNGVIHEIDAVLQQPEDAPAGSIVDVLNTKDEYSTLVSLIKTAGLEDTLNNVDAAFTVFAPTNTAITNALASLQSQLSDPVALAAVLQGHVHGATLSSTELADLAGTNLTMIDGTGKAITSTNGSVLIDGVTVIAPDMQAQNGVIHGIDAVILP